MKIKLIMNSPNLGHKEKKVDIQTNYSPDDIHALYKLYFGVDNLYCTYEIIEEDD